MSVNKYQPHLLVLPEDDANRQLANGFLLELDRAVLTRIQVLPEVGGWITVLNDFESDHISGMIRYPNRYMVLLIDFDGEQERLTTAKERIPQHLRERVFVLGVLREPEDLKRAGLGDYETIGGGIARDCREQTDTISGHELLRHNTGEFGRLRQHVRPILFQPA
ncbi:MAG: hypothetical protein NTY38_18455 [Acidobacteria bacterium]|nr:hypothetical protein [Acidobacteriota bacterium]